MSSKSFFVITLLAVMFLTNPTTEQYSVHAMQIMIKESSKNKQDEALANLIMGGMIEKFISLTTVREDYFLFSYYSTNLGAWNIQCLGAFKSFMLCDTMVNPQ